MSAVIHPPDRPPVGADLHDGLAVPGPAAAREAHSVSRRARFPARVGGGIRRNPPPAVAPGQGSPRLTRQGDGGSGNPTLGRAWSRRNPARGRGDESTLPTWHKEAPASHRKEG